MLCVCLVDAEMLLVAYPHYIKLIVESDTTRRQHAHPQNTELIYLQVNYLLAFISYIKSIHGDNNANLRYIKKNY